MEMIARSAAISSPFAPPSEDYQGAPQSPHNTEAEQCVLGSLLIDPESITAVRPLLAGADFYLPKHREIYGAMLRLDDRGAPTDFTMVADELERSRALERIGGEPYLATVLTFVPTSAHAAHYAGIVRRCAFQRALIQAAGKIAQVGYANGPDVAQSCADAEAALAEVRRRYGEEAPTRSAPKCLWEVRRDG